MRTQIVKKFPFPTYQDWLKEHTFSLFSSRHRGLYAEMAFRKFCQLSGILAFKIDPNLPALDQLHLENLKKSQQKELQKMGKIPLRWYCLEGKKAFFAEVKMGTSRLSAMQRLAIGMLEKNRAFLFQVFEDGEILIKRLA